MHNLWLRLAWNLLTVKLILWLWYPGEDPVQLTSYTLLTEQSPSTSADDHQSAALPSAHESVNTTQAPDIEGQEESADHSLMNINQSLADLRAILENLKKAIQNLESQVQIQMQRESRSLSGSSSDSTFNQPPFSFHRCDTDNTHEQRRREIRERQEREAEVRLRSISASVRSGVSIETMYQQIHLFITTRWSTKLMLLVDGKKFYVWHANAWLLPCFASYS